ncbi:MAG: ABC transporter permease [Planctomycetaceae bacterium]|nr:ABC transporter permease [Planctomycetaceae bacterium]
MNSTPPESLPQPPAYVKLIQVFGPLLALVAVVGVFGIADSVQDGGGTFLTLRNFQVILAQTAVIAVAALGMTLIIVSGGIDLSAGTGLILSATVLAWALDNGYSAYFAVGLCLLVGCLCGLLNGVLISVLKIVPFIVTLGTMTIFLGLAKYMADETTVRPPLDSVPNWLGNLVSLNVDSLRLGLSTGVWLALFLALIVALVLRFTVFGRYVFALGSNEATARLCGINVPLVKISIYGLAGLFVGTAGLYQFAKLNSANPTTGLGMELRIIAAVVIGGGSLNGGQGSVLGTIVGALIMGVIYSGCTQLELRNLTTDILIGVIIIAAVTLDQIRQRRFAS